MRQLNKSVAKLSDEADMGFCFFFIDCDRFKQINDRLGHLIGDKVLIQVANRLSALVGDATCLARLGGDEFVLLMSKLEESQAVKFAQRINDVFAQPLRIRDTKIYIAASVGIVIADGPTMDNSWWLAKGANRGSMVLASRFHVTPSKRRNGNAQNVRVKRRSQRKASSHGALWAMQTWR